MEWKDATNYSQGERGKKAPTSWQTEIDGVRLWLSRSHLYYPDEWVIKFGDVIREPKKIASSKMGEPNAKALAVETAWHKARSEMQKWQGVADTLFASI